MGALGLSRREPEITDLAPVRDHLKVIFDKADGSSRRELAARLFYLHRPELRP